MRKCLKTFAAVTLFIILALGISLNPAFGGSSKRLRNDGRLDFLTSKGSAIVSIDIEIAESLFARARGLMGVNRLKHAQGMFFVYGKADYRVFWMRNTPLSLDILFISDTLQVINIAKSTVRMSDNRYRSEKPAKFVVEVVSGFCEKYGVEAGTRVRWTRN